MIRHWILGIGSFIAVIFFTATVVQLFFDLSPSGYVFALVIAALLGYSFTEGRRDKPYALVFNHMFPVLVALTIWLALQTFVEATVRAIRLEAMAFEATGSALPINLFGAPLSSAAMLVLVFIGLLVPGYIYANDNTLHKKIWLTVLLLLIVFFAAMIISAFLPVNL